MRLEFTKAALDASEQRVVAQGFRSQSELRGAPGYRKEHAKWVVRDDDALRGVLSAEILWDWIYIDELWVGEESRGGGLGRSLVEHLEQFARSEGMQGIWLWTQSWQAEAFYRKLGYQAFTRFENFPVGFSRIGFRKTL